MDCRARERYNFYYFLFNWYWGLHCGACPDNIIWSPIETVECDENGNRMVHFCPSCQAIICHSCAIEIIHGHGAEQVGCRWCGNQLSGITTMYFSPDDQSSGILEPYVSANDNIREYFGLWQKCMNRAYPGFDFEKICWKNRMISDGWKFFIDFNSFLTEQLPNQFGMLISMMMRNSYVKIYYSQPVIHPSCRRFLQMPPPKDYACVQTSNFAHMHSLSLFLTSAMMTKRYRNNLLVMRRYLLSNYAERMMLILGICRLVDERDPFDFDPNRESDRFRLEY
jgi:hypothetical protein